MRFMYTYMRSLANALSDHHIYSKRFTVYKFITPASEDIRENFQNDLKSEDQ